MEKNPQIQASIGNPANSSRCGGLEVAKERFETWSDDCHMFRTVRRLPLVHSSRHFTSTAQSLARVSSCITRDFRTVRELKQNREGEGYLQRLIYGENGVRNAAVGVVPKANGREQTKIMAKARKSRTMAAETLHPFRYPDASRQSKHR